MKRLILALRWPLIIEIANSLLFAAVSSNSFGIPLLSWIITLGVLLWGGWLIAKKEWGTLAHAAWAGPAIFVVGFGLVTTTYHAITGDVSAMAKVSRWHVDPRLVYFAGALSASVLLQ